LTNIIDLVVVCADMEDTRRETTNRLDPVELPRLSTIDLPLLCVVFWKLAEGSERRDYGLVQQQRRGVSKFTRVRCRKTDG
jgi:hypothetical protein